MNFTDYEQVFNNFSVPVSCCNTTNPLANETTCPDIVMDTSTTTNIVTDLYEGDCYVIDRLVPHQVEALTDCDIIESSTFHRDEDSYRVWRDWYTFLM